MRNRMELTAAGASVLSALLFIFTVPGKAAEKFPPARALTYLYEVQDQWHEQFWVFRSQDSGANIIWESVKDANGDTSYTVFHNDTDQEAVGLTCIRMEITHPGAGEWIGWHYLYPGGNWNGEEQGYDLRGSGPLTLQAKANQAGIEVQFRMRCRDAGGAMHSLYPEEADPVSHAVTLTESYQTLHFDLSGDPDLPANVFEPLAVIIQYYYDNPASYEIYLDDIRFDHAWHEDPHLLNSIVPKEYEVDYDHLNQAQVYDNDLVGLALLEFGTPAARVRARAIAEALLFAMNHSPNDEVRLFNAYRSGMLYDRSTGIVAFPGWWEYGAQEWWIDERSVEADTGNMCWTILFFLEIHKAFPGTPIAGEALEAAQWLGDFLLSNLQAPQNDGFLLRMVPSIPGDPTSEYTVPDTLSQSTEMNLDTWIAFTRLHRVDGQSRWNDAATSARRFVGSMINTGPGVVCTGTDETGEMDCGIIAEDVQSWGILASHELLGSGFPFFGRMADYVESEMLFTPTDSCNYYGFDFSDSDSPGPDGVWFEGTAHMVLAYKILGMNFKARFFLDEIERALDEEGGHPEYPLWQGKGVPAACRDCLSTGYDWCYFNRPALAPTAWYLMAWGNRNPLAFRWNP